MYGKKCRLWAEATFCSIWSGSRLFAKAYLSKKDISGVTCPCQNLCPGYVFNPVEYFHEASHTYKGWWDRRHLKFNLSNSFLMSLTQEIQKQHRYCLQYQVRSSQFKDWWAELQVPEIRYVAIKKFTTYIVIRMFCHFVAISYCAGKISATLCGNFLFVCILVSTLV